MEPRRIGNNSGGSSSNNNGNNNTAWRSGPGSGLKCTRCCEIADKMANIFLLQSA